MQGTAVNMSLHFVAQCSAAQQQQRYEDVILQDPGASGDCCSRSFSCWALFDGHNGDTVARYLGSSLLPELESRLPAMPLPQEEPEQYVYADAVRRAVTAAFLSLSLRVCELTRGTAAGCGSAATVVVQTGNLLTVANAGSSKCVLDVGHCAIECSADHRLGNNEDEDERLSAGELRTAFAGELRTALWFCTLFVPWLADGRSSCSRMAVALHMASLLHSQLCTAKCHTV
jgi:serine/threonine protein phosphatase PrpC